MILSPFPQAQFLKSATPSGFIRSGIFLIAFLSLFLSANPASAQTDSYADIKKKAETFYSKGSYSRAHKEYKKAGKLKLSGMEKRWVEFRTADTLWRAQAGTRTSDTSNYDKAQKRLTVLVRDIHRVEERDLVWAEVHESLGDFYWLRPDLKQWHNGWNHYQKALDWWAGHKNIDRARERYIALVLKTASPTWREPYYYYGYYGNHLPLYILENVLKIAKQEKHKIWAHYLIAMTLKGRGGADAKNRVSKEYEAALKGGPEFDWYDDALFNYAQWQERKGQIIILESGQQIRRKNYVKAVELYRRLLKEFKKGETRYYDDAKKRIEKIIRPKLSLIVSNIFLPGSEIEYRLDWRNIKRIQLDLYPVNLNEDVELREGIDRGDWIHMVNLFLRKKLRSWTVETEDRGKHEPGNRALRLKEKLPVGAYILQAQADGKTRRELVLVTDAALVVKTAGRKALVYFSDSGNGSPIANAGVRLWERRRTEKKWRWIDHEGKTDENGMARFDLSKSSRNTGLFVSVSKGSRQALSRGNAYYRRAGRASWKMYVFTDRPAYRPNETAQWKVTARAYDGSVYKTPAGESVAYEITGPRGTKIKEGILELNDFGGGWDSVELTETMALGAYRITFWDKEKKKRLGSDRLFRLEEYKLPEFKVAIKTPMEDGKKKVLRLGETIEIDIQAEYYFGGPVANATVEVMVYQKPFHHHWRPPHEFPWFYKDMGRPPQRYWGRGQQVKRELLKTDASGKAKLTLPTPANSTGLEYRIEARVTDASRREIVAQDTIRVTRQGHFVYLNPEHYLYRPQDKLKIDIHAMDANSQPMKVEGTIRVTRDFWFEIWLDPTGREVKGPELSNLRAKSAIFPPPLPHPDAPPWRLKFRGYQHDEILVRNVKTDAKGLGQFHFTPDREGYYRIAWTSRDPGAPPVKTETTVWVATPDSKNIGYHHNAVEIIVDKDTFRVGRKAPVMLAVNSSDRYVLFSVDGDDLFDTRLIHVPGSVKLVEFDVTEKHVPNIFLEATMVSDHRLFRDNKQVVVPPERHFLEVEVTSDADAYQPREEGLLKVTARDHNGEPVSAEVALGLVDESVYYIQEELAQDPRQFFYGVKRSRQSHTQSTFQFKRFAKLEPKRKVKEGVIIDGRPIGGGMAGMDEKGRAYQFKAAAPMDAAPAGQAVAKSESRMAAQRPNFADMAVEGDAAGAPMELALEEAPGISSTEGKSSVQVRSDFRSTVFWGPNVQTGKDGTAEVKVKFPDSLTQWRATARAVTKGNQFGIATNKLRTRKPLIVRLQAPRFFVVGDELTVSAIINNNTDQTLSVQPKLKADGVAVTGIIVGGKRKKGPFGAIKVPANGEQRLDWAVSVLDPGSAVLRVDALSKEYGDAMEKTFAVHEHGIEKFIAKSGKMRSDDFTVQMIVPERRKPESTELVIQAAPSLAVALLDSLPYLIDYPYGCTEQTMSRFLPAVIVSKTLADLGLDKETIAGKVFGGIEEAHSGKTHPKGKKNLDELDAMVEKGLDRLYDFQRSDGGWGWWKKGDSDHFMSAYVLWGLTLASGAGIDVDRDVMRRAADFLDKVLVEAEEQYDLQAWMLHALSARHAAEGKKKISKFQSKAFQNLWEHRARLNAYSRALAALTAANFKELDKAKVLIENLENGVKVDETPDTSIIMRGEQTSGANVMATAHWGEEGLFRRWSHGGVESTAFALMALLSVDAENDLIEPVTNWLIKNRRGAHWSNTRDTAISLLALNDYLKKSGELEAGLEYEIFVNGESVAQTKVEDPIAAPSSYRIDNALLRNGINDIRFLKKGGDGPIYFSVQIKYFSLEEPIRPAGNEIFLRRQFNKLVGRPTLLKGYVYDQAPLNDAGSVKSGDRVETVLIIETKNDYEYIVIEDLKPAGLEAVQLRSGEALYARELKASALSRKIGASEKQAGRLVKASMPKIVPEPEPPQSDYTGRTQWVYQELRDRKMVLFVDKLPEGVWEIKYALRAETPGHFHALPVMGHAMYIPEIRANGAEINFDIQDREE